MKYKIEIYWTENGHINEDIRFFSTFKALYSYLVRSYKWAKENKTYITVKTHI